MEAGTCWRACRSRSMDPIRSAIRLLRIARDDDSCEPSPRGSCGGLVTEDDTSRPRHRRARQPLRGGEPCTAWWSPASVWSRPTGSAGARSARRSSKGGPASSSIESFDTSGQPIKIAGEVKNFDVTPYLGEHKKNAKLMSRAVRFAVGAAALAVEDAGLDTEKLDPARFGVCMGTGITPDRRRRAGRSDRQGDPARRRASTWPNSPRRGPSRSSRSGCCKHLPNMAAAHISILHHAMGPNNTIVTACAAGTQAVGEAFRLIAPGRRRRDAGRRLRQPARPPAAGRLQRDEGRQQLDSGPPAEVSRPFDGERDGFVLGEGAAVLVLESLRTRQAAAGDDLRRDHRLRLVVRRLRHHPPRARRQGGGHLHEGRAPRGAGRSCRHRLHQRPRHEHPAQRPDGDRRRQAGLRPPGERRSR